MERLRRSLKGEKDSKVQQHISIAPKSALAIVPPKKVIKALYSYNKQNDQEMDFKEGEFLYVIGRENDEDWYEACNPITNTRGLVPVNYFEALGKTARDSKDTTYLDLGSKLSDGQSTPSTSSVTSPGPAAQHQRTASKAGGAMIYGMVQYDFNAERPDELDAKAGEAIVIIAQSNPEWYVAKPIGRLGGPGLIPVSFIEIRDMTTGKAVDDPLEAVRRAGVPKVEEWKKMAADYKNSSISLGKFESSGTQAIQQGMERMSVSNGPRSPASTNGTGVNGYNYHERTASQAAAAYRQNPAYHRPLSQLPFPVAASIPTCRFDNNTYWYIIEAIMEDGSHWELSRFYHDFYDFQIALLQEFPEEAGNSGQPRTLPYMPGPVTYVTDAISNGRRENLDDYLKRLLAMPPKISRCDLVKQLFAPREGDFELEPPSMENSYRYSGGTEQSFDDSRQASRQASNADLGGQGLEAGQSALSPRPAHQRNQQSVTRMGAPGAQYANGPDMNLAPPNLLRMDTSLTQGSTNSQQTTASSGALILKFRYNKDDTFKLRVPADINLEGIKAKMKEKMKERNQELDDDFQVGYQLSTDDYPKPLYSDYDFDVALERHPKLSLVVMR